jgi:hypothetical protein
VVIAVNHLFSQQKIRNSFNRKDIPHQKDALTAEQPEK